MTEQLSAAGSGVTLTGVTKTYGGDVTALNDVSLAIHPGEFVTFLGPSGSGKSTMLNIIAGFTAATAGAVVINGTNVNGVPPHRRNLGVVFQNYALFPHMTVAENIAYGLRRRGVGKGEQAERVGQALAMVRLEEYGQRRPSELSGGQQQRVALARALVYRPPVLLMDEPLGALDKRLREQMQEEIGRLHRELGTTFVFVTHDQEEALALSDRIALFEDGRLVQVGAPEELYLRPTSLFAAQFLGDSNLLSGVLEDGGWVRHNEQRWRVAGGSLQSGQNCHIVIRPERLTIRDSPDADPASGYAVNSVAAQVTDIIYLGSHRKVVLTYPDGTKGSVKEPVGHESRVTVGDNVLAQWAPEDSTVIPSVVGQPAARTASAVAG